MVINKVRQQEILQHKINQLVIKLSNFIKYGISIRKINKITALRDDTIAAKVIVDAS